MVYIYFIILSSLVIICLKGCVIFTLIIVQYLDTIIKNSITLSGLAYLSDLKPLMEGLRFFSQPPTLPPPPELPLSKNNKSIIIVGVTGLKLYDMKKKRKIGK